MRISGNTILITGGTSGIGLELAARFLALDNTVIVTGRSQSGSDDARQRLSGLHAIQSDTSDSAAIAKLYQRVVNEFPALNMLVNNAGIMRKINLNNGLASLPSPHPFDLGCGCQRGAGFDSIDDGYFFQRNGGWIAGVELRQRHPAGQLDDFDLPGLYTQ
ncbi:MAG TPA: SDR family NAD(P)-dependent oxidoreductase [Galbitalea sp.]